MKRILLLAVVALTLAPGALACSGASPAEPQPSPTPTPTPTPTVAAPGPREVLAGAPIGDPTSGPPAHEAKVVYVGPRDVEAVALTFDTGVGSAHMPEVLDILKERGKLATFGVTGEWAATNPALLKRIIAEGHAIVNHSWSHTSFTGEDTETPPLSDEQIRDELRRTEDKIREIAGVSSKPYFRPPYGDYDSRVNKIAFEEGYEYDVLWYVDGMGWDGRATRYVVNVTLANAFNGAIYLYHTDNSYEYKALEEIIQGLEERGFQMVTIPQLLGQQPMPTPTPLPSPTPSPSMALDSVAPASAAPQPTGPGGGPTPAPAPVPTPMPTPAYTRLAYDGFESADANGGSGWLGPWWSTAPLAISGEMPHSGSWQQNLSSGVFAYRAADLSGQERVHLRFWSRLSRLDPSHRAIVLISRDGSVGWEVVKEFTWAESDGVYHLYDIDLSGIEMSGSFLVGFYSLIDPATDLWHVDDVELAVPAP